MDIAESLTEPAERKLWETPRVIVAEVADKTNGGVNPGPETILPTLLSSS